MYLPPRVAEGWSGCVVQVADKPRARRGTGAAKNTPEKAPAAPKAAGAAERALAGAKSPGGTAATSASRAHGAGGRGAPSGPSSSNQRAADAKAKRETQAPEVSLIHLQTSTLYQSQISSL